MIYLRREVKRIKQISRVISKGTTPNSWKRNNRQRRNRFLKAENIYEGKIFNTRIFYDEETNKILKRSN
ncbi:MAG: hypothetical protein V8T82_03175 [Romboutsia timonensis]